MEIRVVALKWNLYLIMPPYHTSSPLHYLTTASLQPTSTTASIHQAATTTALLHPTSTASQHHHTPLPTPTIAPHCGAPPTVLVTRTRFSVHPFLSHLNTAYLGRRWFRAAHDTMMTQRWRNYDYVRRKLRYNTAPFANIANDHKIAWSIILQQANYLRICGPIVRS